MSIYKVYSKYGNMGHSGPSLQVDEWAIPCEGS